MAFTSVETIVANPGGKKKRMARKMTAKQIRFFGTKRQRAALNHRSRPKRKASARHRARTKPRTRPRARPRKQKRSNPGEIISFLNSAPKRRRKAMAATHSKRKRKAKSHGHRRGNAGRRARPRFTGRRRRSNPGKIMGWLSSGMAVIGGAVISKVGTQVVLGAKNTGWVGYAANGVATAVLGWASHMMFRDKGISQMVVAGGVAQIIVRMITDYTPYGQYLSNAGLGDYMVSNFVSPQRLPDALHSAMMEMPAGWAPTTVVQSSAAGAGVGDLYGAPLY